MIRGFCKICVSAGGGLRHCSDADRCGNWRLISVGTAPYGPPTLVSVLSAVEDLAQHFSRPTATTATGHPLAPAVSSTQRSKA